MPTHVKRTLSQTILMLMGGAFITGMMGFVGVEFIKSHDTTIKAKHISDTVDEIKTDNKAFIQRTDAMMGHISELRLDMVAVQSEILHCRKDLDSQDQDIANCNGKHK